MYSIFIGNEDSSDISEYLAGFFWTGSFFPLLFMVSLLAMSGFLSETRETALETRSLPTCTIRISTAGDFFQWDSIESTAGNFVVADCLNNRVPIAARILTLRWSGPP